MRPLQRLMRSLNACVMRMWPRQLMSKKRWYICGVCQSSNKRERGARLKILRPPLPSLTIPSAIVADACVVYDCPEAFVFADSLVNELAALFDALGIGDIALKWMQKRVAVSHLLSSVLECLDADFSEAGGEYRHSVLHTFDRQIEAKARIAASCKKITSVRAVCSLILRSARAVAKAKIVLQTRAPILCVSNMKRRQICNSQIKTGFSSSLKMTQAEQSAASPIGNAHFSTVSLSSKRTVKK